MLCKFTMEVKSFRIPPGKELSFRFGGRNPINVTISPVDQNDSSCTTVMTSELDQELTDCFRSIAAGEMPKGSKTVEKLREIHPHGGFTTPTDLYPRRVLDVLSQWSRDLRDITERTVNASRWRLGHPHWDDYRSKRSLEFSFDHENWRPWPDRLIVGGFTVTPLPNDLPDGAIDGIADIVRSGGDEPLSQSLYRESLHLNENPRASLIVAIAAIETAVKQCISTLAPDAAMLVEELQSPKLEWLLNDYLPTLKARYDFDGKVLPPPTSHLATLKKCVFTRNWLVHGRETEVSPETVQELRLVVADVLRLLDYYSGNRWARAQMRRSTLSQLIGSTDEGINDVWVPSHYQ